MEPEAHTDGSLTLCGLTQSSHLMWEETHTAEREMIIRVRHLPSYLGNLSSNPNHIWSPEHNQGLFLSTEQESDQRARRESLSIAGYYLII